MIILFFASLAAAHASLPPTSIFGILVGEPLALLECIAATNPAKYHADKSGYKGKFYYKFPDTAPCFERLTRQGLGDSPLNEIVHVQFPLKENLATVADNVVVVQILDGKVEFIRFNTKGRVFQDEDLAIFSAKFGKPTSAKPVPLQNGLGARFEALIAIWKITPNVTATYSSFGGNIGGKYGDFSVGTARGKAALLAPIQAAIKPTKEL
jgi:hypothetical protein